jgi:hypothetical protein
MKKEKCLIQAILLTIACLFSGMGIQAQLPNDSTCLPPKVKIVASNGFKPFTLGKSQELTYTVSEYPPATSRVSFGFIDSDGIATGPSHTITNAGPGGVSWSINTDTCNFPLSSRFQVELQWGGDSTATYRIPLCNLPDTLKLSATAGWGPFTSNQYPLNDSLWNPVPSQKNTITIKDLPPRDTAVLFRFLTADSLVVDSLYVTSLPGLYLDSVVIPEKHMDGLPLSTRYITQTTWCEGGPPTGIDTYHDLRIIPQKPKLFCMNQGNVVVDSIPPATHHQINGNVLMVDSVKHGLITNRSVQGGSWFGLYSFWFPSDTFTIESWIFPDAKKLRQATEGEMTFMNADSAWWICLKKESGEIKFELYFDSRWGRYELFTAVVDTSKLLDGNWHHFSYRNAIESGPYYVTFLLDGQPLATTVNKTNYDLIREHPEFQLQIKTLPLLIGGCRALNDKSSNDRSFISMMDEIRIWNSLRSDEQIRSTMNRHLLQEENLIGYWNFNDLNNRLSYFDDLSFYNNEGSLYEGATLAEGDPAGDVLDSLLVISSNLETDSVRYEFYDVENRLIDGITLPSPNGKARLVYDLSSLPSTSNHLRIREYYPEERDTGLISDYALRVNPAIPLSTARNGWSYFYLRSPLGNSQLQGHGSLFNAVTACGFPDGSSKVVMGLEHNGQVSDTMSFHASSNPYHHSLKLDGSTNYIRINQNMNAPDHFTMMMWFKTNSTEGGCLAVFSDDVGNMKNVNTNYLLAMKKDGSLVYSIIQPDNSIVNLHATSQYNDGAWHHVAVVLPEGGNGMAKLYMDGSIVDEKLSSGTLLFPGNWVFGHAGDTIPPLFRDTISQYFNGAFSEISIWEKELDYAGINRTMYLNTIDTCQGAIHYYPLNEGEGSGQLVHDRISDANGQVAGNGQQWFTDHAISYITWYRDMAKLPLPGIYTLFARVFHPSGPDTGYYYPLGKFNVKDPLPGHAVTYNLSEGYGNFDLGTSVNNTISIWTNYTAPGANEYALSYQFFAPGGQLLQSGSEAFTASPFSYEFDLNMGIAPPGSYLVLYVSDLDEKADAYPLYFPILIRTMAPPKVTGDFGPFKQAIAPGTMQAMNTFTIKTDVIENLTQVKGKFYDRYGILIAEEDATKTGFVSWQLSHDMARLSPPFTSMKLEYYLNNEPFPGLVQGPFYIPITRTRPFWFDFLAAEDFSNINEDTVTGIVTFKISTPIENQHFFDNAVHISIPNSVPLLGGASSQLQAPRIKSSLRYTIDNNKLEIDGNPILDQKLFHLGCGKLGTLSFDFENDSYDTSYLDQQNNLFATQNFSTSGSISASFDKIKEIAEQIKMIVDIAGAVNPESAIISPSFSVSFSGGFKYSSRLNLMLDTINKKNAWGSHGKLNVDSDPSHTDNASYHFYAGSFGVEFEIGAKLLEGLLEGDFCVDLRFNLGFGQSYISIPKTDKRFLKDFGIDIHGKFVVKEFWGLAEQTVWGPRLFYAHKFWGDDLSDLFPDFENEIEYTNGIAGDIIPVSSLAKTPLAYPQASIAASPDFQLFTWLEQGKLPGERHLRSRFLRNKTKNFSDKLSIHSSSHLINNPVSAGFSDSTVLITWTEARHDHKSLQNVEPEYLLRDFAESQDVWYAVYDIANDSIIQLEMIHDNTTDLTSGRAEARPKLTVISATQALLVWQVANLDAGLSDLWYTTLTKQGDQWLQGIPQIITEIEGIESSLNLASPAENMAVLTYINDIPPDMSTNRIITSVFSDNAWTKPYTLVQDEKMYINYCDMGFSGETGGLVYTAYMKEELKSNYENLMLVPWDASAGNWDTTACIELLADSVHHLQYPGITVYEDGSTAIVCKAEQFVIKGDNSKISLIDLFSGNLNNPGAEWYHIPANPYVCDTTKQISELSISWVGEDTLMVLTQEYVMLPANTPYTPVNGIVWGDPYMNQVLRCFALRDGGIIENVEEDHYNLFIEESTLPDSQPLLYQNYPNPCNTHTTIGFELREPSEVLLELYDIRGYRVANLADQNLPAGGYAVRVNTAELEPGTYIYKLYANNAVKTAKMIVIR